MTFSLPLIHALATCFMTGLIWFVQVVHYPLFRAVGPAQFPGYALAHQRRTTWVVAPVMLIELASAVALVARTGTSPLHAWTGLSLLLVIWLSTFLLQVPMHERLATRFDHAAWRRLVVTNWTRTAAWTLRAIIAALMLPQA